MVYRLLEAVVTLLGGAAVEEEDLACSRTGQVKRPVCHLDASSNLGNFGL